MATAPTPLRDIAKVIRSKNAGPFEITLDIVFKTKEDFEAVKKSGVITKELVSELYNVPTQNIITFGFFASSPSASSTSSTPSRSPCLVRGPRAASARPTCMPPSSTSRCRRS